MDVSIQELAALLRCDQSQNEHPYKGKYVLVRSSDAGVHAGTVESVEGSTVRLKNSRRLWYWKCLKGAFLSGVATNGIDDNESKIGELLPDMYVLGCCEIIEVAPFAKGTIDGAPVYEPS